jgi:23S rRNA (guanosine2251-2'-O)-methyltransferase
MRRSRVNRPGDRSPNKSTEPRKARLRPSTGLSIPDRPFAGAGPGTVTLWGRHAVAAAMSNTAREILAIHGAGKAEPALASMFEEVGVKRRSALPEPTIQGIDELSDKVPPDAVHQGLVAIARPLPGLALEDLITRLGPAPDSLLVVLDQVTDPHNVGAVLRSAAAFGAAGVIVQSRYAPPADGVLAKAASGALELVPIVEVTNIARALDRLKEGGFWCVGLSGDGAVSIDRANLGGKIAMVLGAEGPGLRRLPRERCDVIARLPTEAGFATLNISNAAAIALYEARRARNDG